MSMHPQAREDQFLGALLGLAIGDALGRPVRGMDAHEIAAAHGLVSRYLPTADAAEGAPDRGEISDKTEVVLALVESLTTNEGQLDPANINVRLGFLAAGPSRDLMSDATVAGIALAAEHDGLVPEEVVAEPELSVAVRGVPVGLLHAVGGLDAAIVASEAAVVSRLTHAGPAQAALTNAVALALIESGRSRAVPSTSTAAGSNPAALAFYALLDVVREADTFVESVSGAIALGGDTDCLGAVAGALAGARLGASGIPQDLIDGLDARIYVTLATPWFYRTAIRRAGTVIDLRQV